MTDQLTKRLTHANRLLKAVQTLIRAGWTRAQVDRMIDSQQFADDAIDEAERLASAAESHCKQCGQHVAAGLECGCGFAPPDRRVNHDVRALIDELRAERNELRASIELIARSDTFSGGPYEGEERNIARETLRELYDISAKVSAS